MQRYINTLAILPRPDGVGLINIEAVINSQNGMIPGINIPKHSVSNQVLHNLTGAEKRKRTKRRMKNKVTHLTKCRNDIIIYTFFSLTCIFI